MIKENRYIVHDTAIEYTFYNLFFSSLHQEKSVPVNRINAIDLSTSPHSLIIDSREVIFLNHTDTNSLEKFAARHNLPQSTHFDTWAILTRDYLDTQLDEKTLREQDEKIKTAGIGEKEYRKITHSLYFTLSGSLEWNYLGLWDVLAMKQHRNPFYRWYGRKYYWKVMEIALRGSEYQQKIRQ